MCRPAHRKQRSVECALAGDVDYIRWGRQPYSTTFHFRIKQCACDKRKHVRKGKKKCLSPLEPDIGRFHGTFQTMFYFHFPQAPLILHQSHFNKMACPLAADAALRF